MINSLKTTRWTVQVITSYLPFNIDANHYDFSVIVTNFWPKLRCYGQQSAHYGFPIIAGPEPFPI